MQKEFFLGLVLVLSLFGCIHAPYQYYQPPSALPAIADTTGEIEPVTPVETCFSEDQIEKGTPDDLLDPVASVTF